MLIVAGLLAALVAVWLVSREVAVWATFLIAAVVLGRRVVARPRDWAGLVATAALLYVLYLALHDLPGALGEREVGYRESAPYATFQQSEMAMQAYHGVDPRFTEFVRGHIPVNDTFYVSAGPSVVTSGPHSWLQYELLPRVEDYVSPCRAKWIVFYASPPRYKGVLVRELVTYRAGYSLGLVGTPCVS